MRTGMAYWKTNKNLTRVTSLTIPKFGLTSERIYLFRASTQNEMSNTAVGRDSRASSARPSPWTLSLREPDDKAQDTLDHRRNAHGRSSALLCSVAVRRRRHHAGILPVIGARHADFRGQRCCPTRSLSHVSNRQTRAGLYPRPAFVWQIHLRSPIQGGSPCIGAVSAE